MRVATVEPACPLNCSYTGKCTRCHPERRRAAPESRDPRPDGGVLCSTPLRWGSLDSLRSLGKTRCFSRGHQFLERRSLEQRQLPRLAARQIAQFDRPVSDTHQPLDPEAERRAQATDFMLATFGDRDLEVPSVAPKLARHDAPRLHGTIVEHHTLARDVHRFVALSRNGRDVGTLDLAAR